MADAPGSGNEHKIISFAKAFKEHPGFEIGGIVDKDYEKADTARNIWGIKWWGAGESAHDLFFYKYAKNPKIDVAVVTTPDDAHYDILKRLAEYPLRLVICEKPLCTDLRQAREIVELYKAKGIALAVNYTRRFMPYYEDLKRRYEAGEFGEILDVRGFFNRGVLHTAAHMADFFLWFFGDIGYCQNIEEMHNADYRVWQMQFFFEKYFWQEQRIGDTPVWDYYDNAMWYVVDNVFAFLEGNEPIKCTGEDAVWALEICLLFFAILPQVDYGPDLTTN